MATAMDTEKWSDVYKDAKCSICAKENKDEIADYYCYDCNKHLCTPCLGIHDKFNESHNVVQGLEDGKDVLTEKCDKHADELITLYCRQHKELLCRKCRLLDHRKCQEPQNIRESSDELNADPELQAVPTQLKSALDNINKAIAALDKHVAHIQQSGDGFLKDLEDYAKKLLSRIKERRMKGKKDIKSKQEELIAVTKHHRQACALTKDDINQCRNKIARSKEWKANMFVLKKKGQTIAQNVDALYNESDSLIKGHQFIFMTEMKIFKSLDHFYSLVKEVSTKAQDISLQGALVDEVDIPVKAVAKRPGVVQVGRPVKKRRDMSMGEPEMKQINVRIPEDKYMCRNTGCCLLSDGSLVVADYRNSRLKLVDPSRNKITKYCDTDGQPTDMCSIGPQEVAVAFFNSTQVHVYSTVSLTRKRTVELGYVTLSIACHGGLLYCAKWSGTMVYVHDVNSGKKLRQIFKDTDGRKLFSGLRQIAVNGSGDRVYMVDTEKGLVCVGTNGRQIFRLSKKEFGLPHSYGMTTDHHGHVFLCGLDSQKVVRETEDGHVVDQIMSGIKWCLQCLRYDVNKSSLYVGGVSDQLLMVKWK